MSDEPLLTEADKAATDDNREEPGASLRRHFDWRGVEFSPFYKEDHHDLHRQPA